MPIESYKENFKGTLSFITANEPGKMDIAFQILMPGYNYDLGHAGKGPSDGWFFFTSYNSEGAYTKLEVNASQSDKDFIAAVRARNAGELPDVGPRGGDRWPALFAMRRSAWHSLDHAWELQDRSSTKR